MEPWMQGAREERLSGSGWSDELPVRGEVSSVGSVEPWQAGVREESVAAPSSELSSGSSSSVPVEVPGVFHPSPGAVDEAADRMFGEGDRLDTLGERVYRR